MQTRDSLNIEQALYRSFFRGMVDMIPLAISVIPWAILAGSLAIETGLTVFQAAAMSAFVFAGAAQLVSLSMIQAGASFISIYITVFFLTSQHLVYALALRKEISHFSPRTKCLIGFLLTDELFALAMTSKQRCFVYLLGAGFCFYSFWLLFSIVGIFLTNLISDLASYHLDFSIVAIFIAMIVPLCTRITTVVGVTITCISAYIFKTLHVEMTIVFSGIIGMVGAVITEYVFEQG